MSTRRATLTIKQGKWIRLTASNGQILMHSEDYFGPSNATRAKSHITKAMIQYLEGEGYTVTDPHAGCAHAETMCDGCKANLDASDRESGLDLDDAHDANVAQRMGE